MLVLTPCVMPLHQRGPQMVFSACSVHICTARQHCHSKGRAPMHRLHGLLQEMEEHVHIVLLQGQACQE